MLIITVYNSNRKFPVLLVEFSTGTISILLCFYKYFALMKSDDYICVPVAQ